MLAPLLSPSAGASGPPGSGGSGGSALPDAGPGEDLDASLTDTAVPEIDANADPDLELDPNVRFEWAETLPAQSMCGPAFFAGSFSCSLAGNPLSTSAGQVFFTLTEGPEGTLLLTGHLSDPLDLDFVTDFHIDLFGSLDCIENGLIAAGQNGKASGPFGLMFEFSAVLNGTYDPETREILGEVTLTFQTEPKQICEGSFSVGAAL